MKELIDTVILGFVWEKSKKGLKLTPEVMKHLNEVLNPKVETCVHILNIGEFLKYYMRVEGMKSIEELTNFVKNLAKVFKLSIIEGITLEEMALSALYAKQFGNCNSP